MGEFAIAAPYDLPVEQMGLYHLLPVGYTMVNPKEISPHRSSVVIAVGLSRAELDTYKDTGYQGMLLVARLNPGKTDIIPKDKDYLIEQISHIAWSHIDYKKVVSTGGCLAQQHLSEMASLFNSTVPIECKNGILIHGAKKVKLLYYQEQVLAYYSYRVVPSSTIHVISSELRRWLDIEHGADRLVTMLHKLFYIHRGAKEDIVSRLKSIGHPVVLTPRDTKEMAFYSNLGFQKTRTGRMYWLPPYKEPLSSHTEYYIR